MKNQSHKSRNHNSLISLHEKYDDTNNPDTQTTFKNSKEKETEPTKLGPKRTIKKPARFRDDDFDY